MRRRITLLVAVLMLALTMSFGSVAAFASATVVPRECSTFSDPEFGFTDTFCFGFVSTPSGTSATHFTDVTTLEDGTVFRSVGVSVGR